jgi:hypothetical protein
VPLHADRSRLQFIEGHAKRHKWRSVALVGVGDTTLARQLLVHFPVCSVLVVPVWREGLRPSEEGRQRNHQRYLRLWTRSYAKRFEVDEGPPVKVAARMEGRQFDAVVFWDGIDDRMLGVVGAAWAPRVKVGGWLLGLDHRSEAVRSVLNAVAPGWQDHREGVWSVRVRRQAEVQGNGLPVVHDVDSAAAVDDDLARAAAVAQLDGDADEVRPVVNVELAENDAHESSDVAAASVAPKRRGGRPKGSRNKPKDAA